MGIRDSVAAEYNFVFFFKSDLNKQTDLWGFNQKKKIVFLKFINKT